MRATLVVSVEVEVDRVRDRLGRLGVGVVPGQRGSGEGRVVQLEVRGARVYPAFYELREVLVEGVGAESALPVGFEQGRAMLSVTTSLSPELLLRRLVLEVA